MKTKTEADKFVKRFRWQLKKTQQLVPNINHKSHWTDDEKKYFEDFLVGICDWSIEACNFIEQLSEQIKSLQSENADLRKAIK
jgi:hypothetical protein